MADKATKPVRTGRYKNKLSEPQKYKLRKWLEENRENLEKNKSTIGEGASAASAALQFTVLKHHVSGAEDALETKIRWNVKRTRKDRRGAGDPAATWATVRVVARQVANMARGLPVDVDAMEYIARGRYKDLLDARQSAEEAGQGPTPPTAAPVQGNLFTLAQQPEPQSTPPLTEETKTALRSILENQKPAGTVTSVPSSFGYTPPLTPKPGGGK